MHASKLQSGSYSRKVRFLRDLTPTFATIEAACCCVIVWSRNPNEFTLEGVLCLEELQNRL
jgi:hypothetical protein